MCGRSRSGVLGEATCHVILADLAKCGCFTRDVQRWPTGGWVEFGFAWAWAWVGGVCLMRWLSASRMKVVERCLDVSGAVRCGAVPWLIEVGLRVGAHSMIRK